MTEVKQVVRVVLVTVAVILGAVAIGVVAFAAVSVWRWQANRTTDVTLPALTERRPVQDRPEPRAVEPPAGLHLHLHGITAEDVAAILEQRARDERD